MDCSPTPEQLEIRRVARELLRDHPPTWAELAQLDWLGGAELGLADELVLFEELGRAVYHGPFWSTLAVAWPLLDAGERERVAAGASSWTVALEPLVPDLDTARRVAIVRDGEVFELEGGERRMLETLDETRPLGIVEGGRTGRRLAGAEALARARERAALALAYEACGIAGRALELAVEHARQRRQFGRIIGAYQAVAHPLASTYVELELARSLALWACWCVQEGDPRAASAVPSAKARCSEVAVAACERSIQVNGGGGFTWEHPLRGLYRRALWIQAWGEPHERLRAGVAERLLAAVNE